MATTTETATTPTAPAIASAAAPATTPDTIYTAISERVPIADFRDPSPWFRWINCAGNSYECMAMMALRRYMRDRGGLGERDRSLTLYVYVRDTMRLPGVVRSFVMECNRPADN